MLRIKIFYALLFVACAMLYYYENSHLTFILLLVFIFLPVVLYFLNWNIVRKISVKLKLKQNTALKNNEIPLVISFDNCSMLPIVYATVYISMTNSFSNEIMKEAISLCVAPSNITHLKTNLLSEHCGKITISIDKIKYYDCLLLSSIKKKNQGEKQVLVQPEVHTIEADVHSANNDNEESHSYSNEKPGGDSSQIFDYHEYAQGDRIKDINWKLSSRLGKLMIKEFSLPISSSVLLMLELSCFSQENSLSELDAKLEVFASVSSWLSSNDIIQNLSWFDSKSYCHHQVLVEQTEDLFLALNQIYGCMPYEKELLLDIFHTENMETNFSYVVYVTSVLNDEMLQALIHLNHNTLLTVLYVGNGQTDMETIKNTLKSNEIKLLEFPHDKVENMIYKLNL